MQPFSDPNEAVAAVQREVSDLRREVRLLRKRHAALAVACMLAVAGIAVLGPSASPSARARDLHRLEVPLVVTDHHGRVVLRVTSEDSTRFELLDPRSSSRVMMSAGFQGAQTSLVNAQGSPQIALFSMSTFGKLILRDNPLSTGIQLVAGTGPDARHSARRIAMYPRPSGKAAIDLALDNDAREIRIVDPTGQQLFRQGTPARVSDFFGKPLQ